MSARSALRLLWGLIGIGGVAACIALMYFAMRAVLAVGGYCANGGAYQIAVECPHAVAWLFPLAIFGGLILSGVVLAQGSPLARSLLALAWPGLFLSLAWNFLDFGLPWHNQSAQPQLLAPGALFILMGGIPLAWMLGPVIRAVRVGDGVNLDPSLDAPAVEPIPKPKQPPQLTAHSVPEPAAPSDLAGEIERLSALHRSGELDDSEYAAAKRALIDRGGAS